MRPRQLLIHASLIAVRLGRVVLFELEELQRPAGGGDAREAGQGRRDEQTCLQSLFHEGFTPYKYILLTCIFRKPQFYFRHFPSIWGEICYRLFLKTRKRDRHQQNLWYYRKDSSSDIAEMPEGAHKSNRIQTERGPKCLNSFLGQSFLRPPVSCSWDHLQYNTNAGFYTKSLKYVQAPFHFAELQLASNQ